MLAGLAGGALVLLALVALIIAGGGAAYELLKRSRQPDVVVVERAPSEAPSEAPAEGDEIATEAPTEVTGTPPEPDAEVAEIADADPAAATDPAHEIEAVPAAGQLAEAGPVPPPRPRAAPRPPATPRPGGPEPAREAESPPARRLPNSALIARLAAVSPRIQEVRFAMSGGNRHPRIVLRADTTDDEAQDVALRVLRTFLELEVERKEIHGTVVYVDLPPEVRGPRQQLEPFALRQVRIEGTRTRGAGGRATFEAPHTVMAREVHERNGTAMCCRNRRIGDLRGLEIVP
jgi:hypothetical protein